MRIILNGEDDGDLRSYDIVSQAAVAEAALRSGTPTDTTKRGNPIKVFRVGSKLYAVVWNKKSISVWPQR